ncbi:ABC transporter substrate-binding protein [Inquilinus limosus]|uniref:ABC transporter permease n=1 Tax=Inquilinus limosus MP06 TaxID=1398085 RepID=A0A0A0CWW5_9PROT|nr:ABC transporter substrate-binding protein [Inquilinus limosus]KGM30896.1 ABC transporter permease [Inquilinus limosus MP06]
MQIIGRALAAGAALALLSATASAADKAVVAVTAIVEHPSLDAVRNGVKTALAEAGYREGDTLVFQYETAQGSPATAAQIARKYVGQIPDVIVPITTPSAQAVAAATRDIPVVFAAITDPVGAGLVASRERPGGNITGTSDMSPVADHLDLIREIMPSVQTLGVLYNPAEANSVSILAALRAMAQDRGIAVLEAPAARTGDVRTAAQSLIGKADAIYVPTDSTIITAIEAVVGVGIENRIPVFSGDTDSVVRGAVATLGFDYYQVGLQTGAMVVRVLKGENPAGMPVVNARGADLVVNLKSATAMGVTIPPALLARASAVIR